MRATAARYGINPKTVLKWRRRPGTADLPMGPKSPASTVLTPDEEAVVVAFRRHTLLPSDDCPYAPWATIPRLTRSSPHRCLQRHGITEPNPPWADGQVERTNRTIKEATVRPYPYDTHDQLRRHPDAFIAACNFAKRLRTLRGLTPHEFIRKTRLEGPGLFHADPNRRSLGLYA